MRTVTIVILGGTGDLTKKKLLPAINSIVKRKIIDRIDVVSVGRRDYTPQEYAEHVNAINLGLDINVVIHYFKADFGVKNSLKGLPALLGNIETPGCIGRLFYLATSPEHFKPITEQLSKCCQDPNRFNRIMIEKPFGYDLKSSNKLNKSLAKHFKEEQIFRVDHYLGKETVQNILVLRLSNPFFERTWNSDFIEKIAIIVNEDVGVGDRIGYYDSAGAVKDMIQNHLMQMAAFILMDAPKSTAPEHIHEEKTAAIGHLRHTSIALGQYEGYLDELPASKLKTSRTETFADIQLESTSKRWKGAKISLRTGKMLHERRAKIEIYYKKEPCTLFCDISTHPNMLVLNVQPTQDIDFFMNTKVPDTDMDITNIKMNFCRDCEFTSNSPESYEVIIEKSIKCDKTLFIGKPELDASWKLIDKIKQETVGVVPELYKKGSRGPELVLRPKNETEI
jgi:glucose-6-phosphate 1-dehydrogenase